MSQWNGLTCTCITLFCCCTGPVCLSFKHRTASFLHTCSKIIKSCNYCIGVHFLDSETCYDMSCKFLNLTNFLRYSKTNNQVLSLQTKRSSSLLKPNGVSGWHAGIEVFSKLKDGIWWAKYLHIPMVWLPSDVHEAASRKVVVSSSLMFCPEACTLVAVFAGSFYCECITDLKTLKP